jgi:glycosyltransferase involved in cell wall biosynthesis
VVRVLMLIDRLRYGGGAERLVVGLATSLPRDRCAVTVCTTRRSGGALLDALAAAGIDHLGLERGDGLHPLAFRRLARFLRQDRIDVLHAHKLGSNVWGTLLGRGSRVPVTIAHEHGSEPAAGARRLLERHLVGRLADAVVVGSSVDRDNLVRAVGLPPEKVVLIPGGHIPAATAASGDLRAELGVAADTPLIGTVAVLRPEKAIEVLIDAFADLAPDFPEARLVIAGNGPERAALEQRARGMGLDPRIHFLGWRGDVDAVLAALDVAVISSDREGTSLFALESMAAGVPLVSTDVGGPHDMLEHGVSALLFPTRDAAALAAALRGLLADPSQRELLAAGARKVLSEFTIERVAGRFAALYERLLGQRAVAR